MWSLCQHSAGGCWQVPHPGQWWMSNTSQDSYYKPPSPHQDSVCRFWLTRQVYSTPEHPFPQLRHPGFVLSEDYEDKYTPVFGHQSLVGGGVGPWRRVSTGCLEIGGHREGVADSACGERGRLGKLCRNGIFFKFWKKVWPRKKIQHERAMKAWHPGNEVCAAFGGLCITLWVWIGRSLSVCVAVEGDLSSWIWTDR